MRVLAFAPALALVLACSSAPPKKTSATAGDPQAQPPTDSATSAFPLEAEAKAGIENPELAALLVDHWAHEMEQSPVWATSRGDHRFDHLLSDNSDQAMAASLARDREFLARAKAIGASLTTMEKTSRALFIGSLERSIARSEACVDHTWQVSAFSNPVAAFGSLPDRHKIASETDANNLLARYKLIPSRVDQVIANLRIGAARNMYANAESIKRGLTQIDAVLASPMEKWSLLSMINDEKAMAVIPTEKRDAWVASMEYVTSGPIRESFVRYRDFVATELLPKARGPKNVGVSALPIGEACYRARISYYLGMDRSADEVHALGLAEIARINDEMRELGNKLFETKDFGAITTRLRTDPSLYYKTADEVLSESRAALAAAQSKMKSYFGILPKAECIVTPIPDHEAPFSTIAYYRGPHADGSVPGQFFVNTYKPEVRPRFETRVLAYHEAIPGHHLQIAIAQERDKLPAFRRSLGLTAFTEGWALYTERLSREMGLYETDLDLMGMLSYDAWRAARLVVDTGIHAKGWTRERAEEFMREHTALTGDNIINEVDRYINWPGQALAYKIGQLEILRLRKQAQAALGKRFDIRAFHDVVLSGGAVSLPVLAENIQAWIETSKSAAP